VPLRDAWYSRPLAPADEYTGAVIHPIIEPVLSPDGATVVGGRRVGAIPSLFSLFSKTYRPISRPASTTFSTVNISLVTTLSTPVGSLPLLRIL
jgi:hypothetical protein